MTKSNSMDEKDMLAGLASNDISCIYNSLINLRQKYVGNVPRMRIFAFKHGILKHIIAHLEHPRLCNVALSIISNSCMDACLREEILKSDGIIRLARILRGLANEEIKNRACRALGNIALSEIGLSAVHEAKPVGDIVTFLSSTNVEEYQLTAIRTLRILSTDKKKLKLLVRENAIHAVAKLLLLDKPNVVNCSIKALAFMTYNCTADVAQQIRRAEVLPTITRLYSENEDSVIKSNSLTCLENLCHVSAMREELGEAGAFQIFINVINTEEYTSASQSAIMALCMCCTEYWERKQIKDLNGLPILVGALKSDFYEDTHPYVISALSHLCSEIDDPNVFSRLKLCQVLIERLKIFIEKNKYEHNFSKGERTSVKQMPQSFGSNLREKLKLEISEESEICNLTSFSRHDKAKRRKYETSPSSPKLSRTSSNSDAVYSIHSPTYQGVQFGELCNSYASHSSYASFSSPLGCTPQSASPECYSFDWNPGSPVSSYSMLSPWSAGSCSSDVQNMCWSPVLSSRSHTPDSCNEDVDCSNNDCYPAVFKPLTKPLSEIKDDPNPVDVIVEKSNEDNLAASTIRRINHFLDNESKHISTNSRETFSGDSLVTSQVSEECSKSHVKTAENVESNNFPVTQPKTCHEVLTDDSGVTEASCSDTISSIPCNSKGTVTAVSKSKGVKRKLSTISCQSDSSSKNSVIPECIQALSQVEKLNLLEKEQSLTHLGKRLDYYIFTLLSLLTRQLLNTSYWNSIDELDIVVLIRYLSLVSSPNMRAIKILTNLITNSCSFQKLITSNFIGQMESIMITCPKLNACDHCSGVQSAKEELMVAAKGMAESYFGVTTLKNILQVKNENHQVYCLYAISRLFKSKVELCKILVKTDGLSKLIHLLTTISDQFSTAAVTLSHIWHILKDPFTKKEIQESACDVYCKYAYMSRCGKFDVELKTKDNKNIFAVRAQLCDRSDYFYSLLEGRFLEASQNVVSIPTITGKILLHVMHFLHGCQSGWCPFVNGILTADLPDLLQAGDLFLLDNVKKHVQSLMLSRFEMKMAVSMYVACKTFGTQGYSDTLLSYVLCQGYLSEQDFIPCLQKLFSFYQDDIVNYIETFIKECFIVK